MIENETAEAGAGDWRSEIAAAEEAQRSAFLARDLERLSALWAEELTVNSPIGRVLERPQVFDLLARGVIAHVAFEIHVEDLRRHGDVVAVMGHDVVVNAPEGPEIRRRFSDFWQHREGSWRMIARHANVAPAREDPA